MPIPPSERKPPKPEPCKACEGRGRTPGNRPCVPCAGTGIQGKGKVTK